MNGALMLKLLHWLHLARLVRSLNGRSAVIGIPYFWLLLFFMFPFLIVLKISVSEMENVTFKDVLTLKRSEEHRLNSSHPRLSRMPSSA